MTDQDRRRAEHAAREYAETNDAFMQVREAFVARLLTSPPGAHEERETLYHAVRALDLVRTRMMCLISSASDSKTIEAYAASVSQGQGI